MPDLSVVRVLVPWEHEEEALVGVLVLDQVDLEPGLAREFPLPASVTESRQFILVYILEDQVVVGTVIGEEAAETLEGLEFWVADRVFNRPRELLSLIKLLILLSGLLLPVSLILNMTLLETFFP